MKKKLIGKRLTFSGKVYYDVENGELEYSGYIIRSIISGKDSYYTDNNVAVTIIIDQNGKKYLRSIPNGTATDNLELLPSI